ncbi:hypothetical protein Y032_0507g2694 [Ancylostoma ceylanicum]|uniref:Ig-like domain-containing protein n=1 Tax=Ancylostoma ceylanicum TaxID=53326 RepID=A0A016WTN1_9BILA|nr:hypothetical protein Y032_0507g2694 [Ancylostoma ceylanicum]
MSVSGYILPILALSLQILGDSEENREVYAAVGTTIDIYCGTSKSDAQNGEWSYQKRESEPEKRVPEDVIESPMKLEFKIVRQNHSGIYSCTSSNTTIVKITLFVGELPRVPENVHVEPSVDEHEYSFLKIIWDDFDNDYDTEYVLEILNREETRKWTRVARTRNCCIMRYEHVSPARTAQVRLAAVNKYGSSNYSESETFSKRVQDEVIKKEFDSGKEWKMEDLLEDLSLVVKRREHLQSRKEPSDHDELSIFHTRTSTYARCTGCGRNHLFANCTRYQTVDQKIERLKMLPACWKCFSTKHRTTFCRKPNCDICNGNHNVILCKRKIPTTRAYAQPRWHMRQKQPGRQYNRDSDPWNHEQRVTTPHYPTARPTKSEQLNGYQKTQSYER